MRRQLFPSAGLRLMAKSVSAFDRYDLQRFIDAQNSIFEIALAELRRGSKESHWMWFIFPQIAGLGRSPTAQRYAIRSLEEARAYLNHGLLGPRLRQSVETLLFSAANRSPEQIFGSIDAMKLASSLTLFDQAAPGDIFAHALDRLFGGQADARTLALLTAQE